MSFSVSFLTTCAMLVSAAYGAAIPVTVTGSPNDGTAATEASLIPSATLASEASHLPEATGTSFLSSGFSSAAAPTATVFACGDDAVGPSLAASLIPASSDAASLVEATGFSSFDAPSATSLALAETDAATTVSLAERTLIATPGLEPTATSFAEAPAATSGFDGATYTGEPSSAPVEATQLSEAVTASIASPVTIDGCAPTATATLGAPVESGISLPASLASDITGFPSAATELATATSANSEVTGMPTLAFGTNFSTAETPLATGL